MRQLPQASTVHWPRLQFHLCPRRRLPLSLLHSSPRLQKLKISGPIYPLPLKISDSVPVLSSLVSSITTVVFLATSLSAGLLAIGTASLLCSGAFSRPSSNLISEPSRNMLRIVSHVQIFAMSKWLGPTLPVEYFEFLRGIEWSIPYLSLPWETVDNDTTKDSRFSFWTYFEILKRSNMMFLKPSSRNGILETDSSVYGTPLAPTEYELFLENHNMKPEADFITFTQSPNWWTYFGRNIFWLAVIGGGLILLHAAILFILKLRRKNSEKHETFGALVFPRFEIALTSLALPCICQASATIIREKEQPSACLAIRRCCLY